MAALDEAGLRDRLLAVRSSAVGEDGASASFAGQFDTVLGVRAADAEAPWDAVRRVWASAFSAHASAYRARQGGSPPRMAVVIQEMVDARTAGVAFSADPVRGRPDVAVVSAVHGLGEGLVSGELDADTYRVSADGAVESEVAAKERALALQPDGGSAWIAVPPADRLRPALTDTAGGAPHRIRVRPARGAPARRAAGRGMGAGGSGGRPASGELILQTRTPPITTRAPSPVPDPRAGRRAADVGQQQHRRELQRRHHAAHLQLCAGRVRGGLPPVLPPAGRAGRRRWRSTRRVFANMLGLVQGRVYYNLLNWYRALALLPGFTVTARSWSG